jgi:hypothetical protein
MSSKRGGPGSEVSAPFDSLCSLGVNGCLLVALLVGTAVDAHPRGFHKKLVLTAYKTRLEGLLAMDADGGERTRGLRAAADTNGDQKLSKDELKGLQDRLVKLATESLKLDISSAKVAVEVKDAKLNVRGDFTVSDAGLSLAVLLVMKHPHAVTPGMTLTVEDRAPDLSHVALEVFQATGGDAGAEVSKVELENRKKHQVRLGVLVD